ncbi:MAG: hypothetical protein HQ534_04190 [Armatimonadetes bacterium]|nr:hypothetical protein [Armatimonadota bacterium]
MKKIFLIMLLLTVLVSMLLAEKWIYEMENITIPVGEGEDELYVYDSPDHLEDAPDYGPKKLALDGADNLYIANLNKKNELLIKKFDLNGCYLCSMRSNDGIADFMFCDNKLYVLKTKAINTIDRIFYLHVFSNEFVLIDSLILQNEIIAIGNKLISNNQGEIGVTKGCSFEKIGLEKKKAVILEDSELFENITVNYDWRKKERIVFFKDTNKEVNLYELWDVSYHNFLNIDKYNNMYYELIYLKNNIETEIVILSNKGKPISTNIHIENYENYGLKLMWPPELFAGKDGSLYQLIPMKDRVEIRKWHKVGEEK